MLLLVRVIIVKEVKSSKYSIILNFKKNFIQENKSVLDLMLARYIEWKVFKANATKLTTDKRNLFSRQEEVFRALGLVDDNITPPIFSKLLKNEDFAEAYKQVEQNRKYKDLLSLEEQAVLKFYTNESYYKFNQAVIKGISESDIIEIDY